MRWWIPVLSMDELRMNDIPRSPASYKTFSMMNLPRLTWYALRRWPIIPGIVIVMLVFTGIFAPVLAPQDQFKQNLRARNAPPVWNTAWYEEHPRVELRYVLGADHVGRDVLSRIIFGARISLVVASVALLTGLLIGVTFGLTAGYFGGHIDELVLRMTDVWYAIPFLLLALVANIIFGPSLGLVLALLALSTWPAFVRNIRAETLSLKTRDYVALARVSGASNTRILVRHLLPGVFNTVVVIATLQVGQLILAEASLSFLGVGIPAPTPAWGVMIAEGRADLRVAWWPTFFPGFAIFLVVMSLNFFGDWLRDRLDPRLRQL